MLKSSSSCTTTLTSLPDFSVSVFHSCTITFLSLAATVSDMVGFSLLIH